MILKDKANKSYPPSKNDIILPSEWIFAIWTIFFVIILKSSASRFIWDKGSLIWASKPADKRIISGLKLSIFDKILCSNISIYSSLFVPGFIDALKILPTPLSSSNPVPGNNGDWWIDPYAIVSSL